MKFVVYLVNIIIQDFSILKIEEQKSLRIYKELCRIKFTYTNNSVTNGNTALLGSYRTRLDFGHIRPQL